MSAALHRFQGCVVGLAVGDALGWPVEFVSSLAELRARFGPDGISDFVAGTHPPGTFTDDTQMSLAVARALLALGHEPLDVLMRGLADEFVAWRRSPENDRAPGRACLAGCDRLARGVAWHEAGQRDSKGCGTAMRTAPIGLYHLGAEQQLVEVAGASALLTHGHPTARAAAIATAALVAWAAAGDEPSTYAQRLIDLMERCEGGEVARLVERVPALLSRSPDEVLSNACLGEAWTGDSAVASALYCFLRTPDDYVATVLTGANTVGDSDSIACIAGAISGAYNGLAAIPVGWRQRVERSEHLLEIGAGLQAACRA